MYALIHNNEIKAGPREWSRHIFEVVYNELTGGTATLPSTKTDSTVIDIDVNTKIVPVFYTEEAYNPKIEQPSGPTLTMFADHVDAHMSKTDKNIDTVKGELKALVATLRYEKEVGGVEVSGSKIKTDRESQSTLSGAVGFMELSPTSTINWKSDSGWVQMNRTQVETVALAVAQHVQSCFNQEKTYGQQIDACTTLAELDALTFTF